MNGGGRFPLRWVVPALLLVGMSSTVILGAYLDRLRARRIVAEEAKTLLRAELVRVQQTLELLERGGASERIADEIALIATEADCEAAVLLAEGGVIRAGTRLDLVGSRFDPRQLGPRVVGVAPLLERAEKELRPVVEVLPGGDAVAGIAPVSSPVPGELRGARAGFLVEVRDLRVRRETALQVEAVQLASYALAVALFAGGFLVFFHLSFGRRAGDLVVAARRFARGQYDARSNVHGRDELAMLGRAFDQMADDVQAAQEQLEQSERRYHTLFDASGDGIFIIEDGGRIADVNARAVELAGYPREALVGMRLEAVMRAPEPSGVALELAEVRADRTTLIEQTLVQQHGTRLVAEVSARRLPNGMVQVLTRDITARKRMAEDLARTERLASVGTLAAGVAHEINNPLMYVDTNVELALKELDAHRGEPWVDAVIPLLSDAREGADRVATVVKDLRGLTAGRDSHQASVDLKKVVASAVKLSALDARHRTRVVTELADVPHVYGNEAQLGQVVVNLVINAAQAFREPGSDGNLVVIRTYCTEEQQAIVEVTDNGPGIPPEVEAHIFEPFFTTKPVGQGTGLGLFVCQRIVQAHGGLLRVETEVGRGTTMRMILPGIADEGTPAPRAEVLEPVRGLRVLVVDDLPLVRRLAGRALASHQVTLAEGGAEALEHCLRTDFDVILSDLMMPGMTGMELHARLAEQRPELADRMIFMSGGAVTEEAVAFLQRFVGRIVEKPATLTTIQRAVEAAGRRRRRGSSLTS